MPLSDKRLVEIRRNVGNMDRWVYLEDQRELAELLAAYDEQRAEVERLREDGREDQRRIIALFPDRATDGTLHHAVLIAVAEVERLRAQVADAWDQGHESAIDGCPCPNPLFRDCVNPHRAALASEGGDHAG